MVVGQPQFRLLNFDYIKRTLDPNPNHNRSALSEFLPPPKAIDIKQVKGLYRKGDVIADCAVEIAIWDSVTDFAILTVTAPPNEPNLFEDYFLIGDVVPKVNDYVVMIGFGEMKVLPIEQQVNRGEIQRRLVARLGRVEGIYPDGYLLLKTPCIKTTVPVFSGMSGGLVSCWTRDGQKPNIKPFAVISYAPEPQPTYDRSRSGESVGSLLNGLLTLNAEGNQVCQIKVNNIG